MLLVFCFALLVATFGLTSGQGYQYNRRDFNAIRMRETGHLSDEEALNAVGDNGRSIGPYQIMKNYYKDAVKRNPELAKRIKYKDLKGPGSVEKSEEIMQAYSNRYTTTSRLGREPTFEDAARNHNGGPNGYKRSSTRKYWRNVKRFKQAMKKCP